MRDMLSALSKSSSFVVKCHLIPFLPRRTMFLIIQSMINRNRNPDRMYPCFTPVSIFRTKYAPNNLLSNFVELFHEKTFLHFIYIHTRINFFFYQKIENFTKTQQRPTSFVTSEILSILWPRQFCCFTFVNHMYIYVRCRWKAVWLHNYKYPRPGNVSSETNHTYCYIVTVISVPSPLVRH